MTRVYAASTASDSRWTPALQHRLDVDPVLRTREHHLEHGELGAPEHGYLGSREWHPPNVVRGLLDGSRGDRRRGRPGCRPTRGEPVRPDESRLTSAVLHDTPSGKDREHSLRVVRHDEHVHVDVFRRSRLRSCGKRARARRRMRAERRRVERIMDSEDPINERKVAHERGAGGKVSFRRTRLAGIASASSSTLTRSRAARFGSGTRTAGATTRRHLAAGEESLRRSDARLAPPRLIGVDDRTGDPGTPCELRLADAGSATGLDDQLSSASHAPSVANSIHPPTGSGGLWVLVRDRLFGIGWRRRPPRGAWSAGAGPPRPRGG